MRYKVSKRDRKMFRQQFYKANSDFARSSFTSRFFEARKYGGGFFGSLKSAIKKKF